MKNRIGIRPTIDGRWGGIREGLEEQTMKMAKDAKKLIRKIFSDNQRIFRKLYKMENEIFCDARI